MSFIKNNCSLKDHINNIKHLLSKQNYPDPIDIKQLPGSGSNRIYYRVYFPQHPTLLAAYNPDVSENIAWYSFSIHFLNIGLPVPEIYGRDDGYQYFLLQDLGDDDLFGLLNDGLSETIKTHYKNTIEDLIRFQTEGIKGLDLDVAYPVSSFDRKSILWDLNYFKYYFVKPHEIEFNERKLEEDFEQFTILLLEADPSYFMYRDFQARNILINNNKNWYIDFQGGRKGPLQYDLVSLLYQAKANLPTAFRNELYNHYLSELEKVIPGKKETFNKYFPFFIYFRIMQVLGAYGFRGIIQRKGHFLNSIPYAINNLKQLMGEFPLTLSLPEFTKIFNHIINLKQYGISGTDTSGLTISIHSFSYKKSGYPTDRTENGGGFAFDCRALPNPGRLTELRNFTGKDKPVIAYLKDKEEVTNYLTNVYQIVDQSIDNYLERGFKHLQVNFGCTGGQHRSVYSAEQLKKHLQKYGNNLTIELKHIEIDKRA